MEHLSIKLFTTWLYAVRIPSFWCLPDDFDLSAIHEFNTNSSWLVHHEVMDLYGYEILDSICTSSELSRVQGSDDLIMVKGIQDVGL